MGKQYFPFYSQTDDLHETEFLRQVEENWNPLKNSAEPVPYKVQTLMGSIFWTVVWSSWSENA